MTKPRGSRTSPPRLIAVVDDDYRVLESLDDLLQSSGYRTTLHASAEEFLESANLNSIDLLISDIGLPGLSGIELLRTIRQRLKTPIPTILITGRSEMYLEQEAKDLGALRFFTKPFDTQELLTTLEQCFAS
jgi:FixJ family two-component response regulator